MSSLVSDSTLNKLDTIAKWQEGRQGSYISTIQKKFENLDSRKRDKIKKTYHENTVVALSSPEHFIRQFLKDDYQFLGEARKEIGLKFAHEDEKISAQERMCERRDEIVCSIPVQIITTPLESRMVETFAQFAKPVFGGRHAALRVGNVLIDWNRGNLVYPKHYEEVPICIEEDPKHKEDPKHNEKDRVVIELGDFSKWIMFYDNFKIEYGKLIDKVDLSGEEKLVRRIIRKKEELLQPLMETITNYNRYYHYNLLHRNCHHFVLAGIRALDYDKNFVLKKMNIDSATEAGFTHSDLDKYVKSQGLESMSEGNLEHLLYLYYHFHQTINSREDSESSREDSESSKEDPKSSSWQCPEQCCQMENVEKKANLLAVEEIV